MNTISSILGLFVASIFWIVSFFKLSKIEGGIAYFIKHLGLCLLTCFVITVLFMLSLDDNVGLEIILFILLIGIIDAGVMFIWSIFLYIRTLQKEKEARPTANTENFDDILDDMPR